MEYRKEEHIYNLSYKGKVTHYLDDVLFQDDKSELNLAYECPRLSEMAEYIEEFVVNYLTASDFQRESIIVIDCGSIDYKKGLTPKIKNKDSSSVHLFTNKKIMTDIFGEEKVLINFKLELDISKSHKEISGDIKEFEENNNFFSFYKMLGEKFNITTEQRLCALIGSARLDLMENPDYPFMIMEYAHLRKFVPMTESMALRTISKIYNFTPQKTKI